MWLSASEKRKGFLNLSVVEELESYLKNKEAFLGSQLVGAVHVSIGVPSLIDHATFCMSLDQAIDKFEEKVELSLKGNELIIEEAIRICKRVNEILWNYVEVLETCAKELFQQIDLTGFEQWNEEIVHHTVKIKEIISLRLESLTLALFRLQTLLKKYQKRVFGKPKQAFFKFFMSSYLQLTIESSLFVTLKKCRKYINFRLQQFMEEYKGYLELCHIVEVSQIQLYSFPAYLSMDLEAQSSFKRLHKLIKIWDLNRSGKILPPHEPVRALETFGTQEYILEVFQEYFFKVHNSIFDKSRSIKARPQPSKDEICSFLALYHRELCLLENTIGSYRKYLRSNDYTTSQGMRKSLYHRIFCLASPLSKQISMKIEACRKLSSLCLEFQDSLKEDKKESTEFPFVNEVTRCLHEMSQPLASKDWMSKHAKILLKMLQQLDETATSDSEVVNYIGLTLCKVLKEDWKYHVLADLPLFEQIYQIHKNIAGFITVHTHVRRLHSLQRILKELSEWTILGESAKRLKEVELDLGDIENYLQSFLAELQQVGAGMESTDTSSAQKTLLEQKKLCIIRESLLEYLYLFASFFHNLPRAQPGVQMLRQKLLFVGQYFDAIHVKLEELELIVYP